MNELSEILADVMAQIRKAMREQLAAQGHVMTGKLSESIEYEISVDGTSAVGRMYMEDYGLVVETGVSAGRIPYGGTGGTKGKTSKYIQGLITFWEGRGLTGREAISAAFATAKVHAKEGMPTRASYAHSSTGERTGFVRTAIENTLEGVGELIEKKFGQKLLIDFGENFAGYEKLKLIR